MDLHIPWLVVGSFHSHLSRKLNDNHYLDSAQLFNETLPEVSEAKGESVSGVGGSPAHHVWVVII